MKRVGTFELKEGSAISHLFQLVISEKGGPKMESVGKNAPYILDKLGIGGRESARVTLMEAQKGHLSAMEGLMIPILPIARVADAGEVIEIALVAERDNRHTAVMHSRNVNRLIKMAKLLQTTTLAKNVSSYAGIGVGGEDCTTLMTAGPTGEGLATARSFCGKRRCAMSDALHIR